MPNKYHIYTHTTLYSTTLPTHTTHFTHYNHTTCFTYHMLFTNSETIYVAYAHIYVTYTPNSLYPYNIPKYILHITYHITNIHTHTHISQDYTHHTIYTNTQHTIHTNTHTNKHFSKILKSNDNMRNFYKKLPNTSAF